MNRFVPRGMGRLCACALFAQFVLGGAVPAQDLTLEYEGRYNCLIGEVDHLMNVLALSDGRALISGTPALTLVDLADLPPEGDDTSLCRLTMFNAREAYTNDEHYFYVNVNGWGGGGSFGFMVVELVGNELIYHTTIEEEGVFYEKMCLVDDYLYVAAHSHGLRIYRLTDPLAPVLVGSLTEHLDDAFDVDVVDIFAYIADGAGGLKIVDVSDPTAPSFIGGEAVETAAGTAQEISVHDGYVYMAAGSAGVAFFPSGDTCQRVLYPVENVAEHLAWSGDHLCVSDMHNFYVYAAADDGSLELIASETTHRRGQSARLHLCVGIDATDAGQILCAGWNFMDVYRLLPVDETTQADLSATRERIRFCSAGGTETVTVFNNGVLPLTISDVVVTDERFGCDYTGGTLLPGESATCQISYDGTGDDVRAHVYFYSDDYDENPLPLQVFGRTTYLDPGENAANFTMPVWSQDAGGNWVTESFTLNQHLGEVVWFQIYGTW